MGPTRLGLDCGDPSFPLVAVEKITKPIAKKLVFFATCSRFASLPKLPRLEYLGLGRYTDVVTAMPAIEKTRGRLRVLGVFYPEATLDEAVRPLLPKGCRTLAVPKMSAPVVEGCIVDPKSFTSGSLMKARPDIARNSAIPSF